MRFSDRACIAIMASSLFLGGLHASAEETRERHLMDLGCKPDKIIANGESSCDHVAEWTAWTISQTSPKNTGEPLP